MPVKFELALTLAGLSGLVLAGPKVPRTGENALVPRQFINSSDAVSLQILTKTGTRNATAPLLYGWMFEDINHSGDGGLYGELLTNRAFDGSDVTWGSIPGYTGNSLVYQENSSEAFGKVSRTEET
jgi:alpha-N-arabinofuranosidase